MFNKNVPPVVLVQSYRPPQSATAVSGGSPCDGVYYANKSDIMLIFGSTNVTKWADLDNSGAQPDIDARICWALKESHNVINDKLTGGPYTIPFVLPYPAQLIDACARLAGVMLYESRGVTDMTDDQKPRNQLSYHREMVMKLLKNLLSDRVRFINVEHTANYPEPVIDQIN